MQHLLFALVITFLPLLGSAQFSYKVDTYQPTPATFNYLLLNNGQIEDNDTINEEILDLVQPMVTDSVLGRKKEHHQLFLVGWFIHAFGDYNWRALSMVKEKFVGTVRHHSRSGAEEYSEYDINYDLNFHLQRYLDRAFYCYDCQKKIGRQDIRKSHRTNYNVVPFVRDTNNVDISNYRMHCEMTPPKAFRAQLNYQFFPALPGLALKDHQNFGTEHPSMGFYGAKCLDCNHNCHPELHPYEWVWWLNLHPQKEKGKTWVIGLFYESSNRFRHWSHNPKTGMISIPFVYKGKNRPNEERSIFIEHLVLNKFEDAELSKLPLPQNLMDAKKETIEVNVSDSLGNSFPIHIQFSNALPTNGIKYWLSNLNWDEQNSILSGYFNLATSARDLYTTRITFSK